MIIGFDGRYAEGDLVGIGKYIQNLIRRVSKKEKCIIFYSKRPKVAIKEKNIKSVILKTSNRYVFEQISLPRALKREKVNFYHAAGNMGVPLACPVPAILTVHDIIPLEIEGYFSYSPLPLLSKLSYLFRLKSSLSKAKKIVTVSNFVKNELVEKLKVRPDKIKTIYSGMPAMPRGGVLPKELSSIKYILNNGGIDIRKNLDTLIKAFAVVHKRVEDIKLVITGENKRIKHNLEILIKKYNLSDSVIFTGYVDDKTLTAIIKSAILVCYPTLSEGFGFPILEAFSLGIPVISSGTSSIPEIADGAAILVNPKDSRMVAGAILKVLNDNKLVSKLEKLGLERVKSFSWEKTTNEYLDLYHNI